MIVCNVPTSIIKKFYLTDEFDFNALMLQLRASLLEADVDPAGNSLPIVIQQHPLLLPIFRLDISELPSLLPIQIDVNLGRLTETKKTLRQNTAITNGETGEGVDLPSLKFGATCDHEADESLGRVQK